jgi:HAD superfamily hydrolase (TIGR01484 family)
MRPIRYLLASDLDGTLIPPGDVSDEGGVDALSRALSGRSDVALAYVTGRHLEHALRGIALRSLPIPDALVCDVGTSLFVRETAGFVPDAAYRDLMMSALSGGDLSELRERLALVDGLDIQDEDKQAEFKLSYYTEAGARGESAVARAAALAQEILDAVNIVHSVDASSGRGLLDILPAGVAKDTAVRYLSEREGLSAERVMFAGDSGNDRAALLSGFNAVVVGNASDALKESVRAEAAARGLTARLYVADRSYARGVLEGGRRFGIL